MDSEEKLVDIINTHKLIIYKVCMIYANKNFSLDDLFQLTIINIWKGLDSFNGYSKLSSWVYRIAINTCISAIRKRKKELNLVPLTKELEEIFYDCSSEHEEIVQQLFFLINQLDSFEKSVILLYLEQYTHEEMGVILGISKTNVGTKINRIKKKLIFLNNKEDGRKR